MERCALFIINFGNCTFYTSIEPIEIKIKILTKRDMGPVGDLRRVFKLSPFLFSLFSFRGTKKPNGFHTCGMEPAEAFAMS